MSDTPLSDLIDLAEGSDQGYRRFLAAFRRSQLGVRVVGAPQGAAGTFTSTEDQPFSLGSSVTPDGRSVLLAFADPAVFIQRFGMQFNAGISGEVLLDTVLLNPDCHGVRVNSAKREISVMISRDVIQKLKSGRKSGSAPPVPARRAPWWKFW
jgi:hypothetical protein